MTQSYRYADTSIIAPFEYTTMIWALPVGWFVFGDLPTLTVMHRGGHRRGAGLFIVWRERQLGLMRDQGASGRRPERPRAAEPNLQRPCAPARRLTHTALPFPHNRF